MCDVERVEFGESLGCFKDDLEEGGQRGRGGYGG